MIVLSELAEVTCWPFTLTMTSPAARPALAAGVPGYEAQTSAPDWVGTLPPPTPPPLKGLPDRQVAAALGLATPTPMNPPEPIRILSLEWPAAICLAIDSALLIGTAKPMLVPAPPSVWLFAAVVMPITWPAELAQAPPESPGWIGAL